jgi:WD40-like Beta Propeller Repeat
MSDDLDLGCVDQRHEPDPQFRAALHRRLVAIVEGSDPASVPESVDVTTIELEPARRRAEPKRRNRWITRVGIAVASAAAIVALIVIVRSDDDTRPADTPSVSTSVANGWVAFAATGADGYQNVYLVREGSPPRPITELDTPRTDQVCPAFSPDGRRLLYGQSARDSRGDPALVITDLSADGAPVDTITIPLDGATLPPCAIWSPDGRWAAFGVSRSARVPDPMLVDEVWVVGTVLDDIRRLTGLSVTDLEWAPHAAELAIAGDRDGVSLYSMASDETRPLGGAGAKLLSWSPDGQTIAFTRNQALLLMDADGTNERTLVPEFRALHGLGPVWSPDGDRIAYQRLCARVLTPGGSCREEHEVVLVTVNDDDEERPAGTQVVMPPPQTTGPDGPMWWYPWSVTWSPDGTALLYLAWPAAEPQPTVPPAGVVAVPVDRETRPVVLSGDLTAAVYSGFPWLPIQSWGRQPGG